jgi:acetoin utilization deacetylase AcuC-like enzyme
MKIIFSEECLKYGTPWHPESADRVRLAADYLKDLKSLASESGKRPKDAGGADGPNAQVKFEFLEPSPATDEDILKVHSREHVRRLKNLEFYDGDSPAYPDIYTYAALSAGGAVAAAQQGGFSLMRPPGHHAASSRAAGFCYLNNIAIAVRKVGKKTLIIDIDGHHGDGTQAIFLGDPNVTYVSLHRSPLYPGSGLESVDNCHNYPLPALCGDSVYLETLDRAFNSIDTRGIEQVAISAGFDAYESDPLASLGLTSEAYRKIGQRIARLKRPVFAVLEGGYDAANVGRNIEQLVLGLSGDRVGAG